MKNLTSSSTGNHQKVGEEGGPPSPGPATSIARARIPAFLFGPLQEGVFLETRAGISLHRFLTEGLGIAPGYVASRITTVFLDGVPVDDLQKAWLAEGSVIALSAAMPGLAGSILRKGGHLAPLRSMVAKKQITPGKDYPIFVKVKLFNSLIQELAQSLLAKGIWLKASLLPKEISRQGFFLVEEGPQLRQGEDELVRLSIKKR
jgi:hypothetical protein